jgi:hypothetical protein
MMIAKHDYRSWGAGAPVERLAMIAKRDYRSSWRLGAPAGVMSSSGLGSPAEWEDRNKPYELIAVCLWSVVGVALSTLLMWLALGGYL